MVYAESNSNMLRKKYLVFLSGLALAAGAFVAAPPACAATTVTGHSVNASSVGRYQKFEITFQISRSFPADSFLPYYYYDANDTPARFPGRNSPYGVDGITINAIFTSPSGKQLIIPAFYYQDYTRTRSGDTEIMTPGSNFSWKVRFAPEETGNYQYYLTIADKDGTSRYPASGSQQFAAIASNKPGFIRTSPRDSRFLEYSNGISFVPIGAGHQWWKCCGKRSYDYDEAFDQFGANGTNFTRIWSQNDGYALTVEGRFDAYKYPDDYNPQDRGIDLNSIPKGTQINQRGAYQLDKIIEAAERNNIAIVDSSHEDPYWIWDVPREAYTNELYTNYWKRNYRYRIARWGYSTSLLAWERWNEHGHISTGSNAHNWYVQFASWVRANDPYRHLFTTSQGSQAYSPGFFSSSAADYTSYHDYLMSNRYPNDYRDEASFIYRAAQCLRTPRQSGCFMGDGSLWSGAQKPIYFGEFDSGTTNWNEPNPNPRVQHNGTWAGLFSVAGSGPLDWYWEKQTYVAQKLADNKIISQYFSGVDYAGEGFTYYSTSDVRITTELLTASNAKIRVLGMKSSDNRRFYAWVQHRDFIWVNSGTPAAVSGTVTIPGLVNGTYTIEQWNTTTGAKTLSSQSVSGGSLNLAINNLTTDMAFKIYTGGGGGTTPTPSPTPGSKPGDANGDNKVDGVDYTRWLNSYNTAKSGPVNGDFNNNGFVDGVDYTIWLNNYGK